MTPLRVRAYSCRQVGPLPVVIGIAVPVHVGFDISATFDSSLSMGLSASGSVKYGISYDSSNGFVPISQSSYTHKGSLGSLTPGPTSDSTTLQLYVMPVAVVNVEYIGGPNVGLKGFAEFAISAGTEATCGDQKGTNIDMVEAKPLEPVMKTNHQMEEDLLALTQSDVQASPSPQPAPPAVGVQASVGLGLQATIGGKISIHAPSMPPIYTHTFAPKAVYSMKWPITSGCISTYVGEAPPDDEAHTYTLVPPIAPVPRLAAGDPITSVYLKNSGTVPGTTWHGTITRLKTSGDCASYPATQVLSLQLINVPYDGSLTLVGANNYNTYSSGDTSGEACVVQSGFTANWYASGSLTVMPATSNSDYSGCTLSPPKQPYGYAGTFTAGWKSISAQDSMQWCVKPRTLACASFQP